MHTPFLCIGRWIREPELKFMVGSPAPVISKHNSKVSKTSSLPLHSVGIHWYVNAPRSSMRKFAEKAWILYFSGSFLSLCDEEKFFCNCDVPTAGVLCPTSWHKQCFCNSKLYSLHSPACPFASGQSQSYKSLDCVRTGAAFWVIPRSLGQSNPFHLYIRISDHKLVYISM